MNHRDNHTAGAAGALPPALRAELAEVPADEQAALAEVWALSAPDFAAEPDEATFRRLGAEIWPNLEAALGTEEAAAPARIHRMRPALRLVSSHTARWAAVAASIVVLLGVGLALWQQPVELNAPRGEIATYTLPDGSEVTLNSGSTLEYRKRFGQATRNVRLVGEGYFAVAEAETEFTVETFNGRVTVLGTQFNVRAWPDDAATIVAVQSGRVAFGAEYQQEDALLLVAGMAARLAGTATLPEPIEGVAVDHAFAWRDGGFKFVGESFGTVLHEIERRYDVPVTVVPEAEALLDISVAILIEASQGPAHILDGLCEIHACQYRPHNGGYEIFQGDAE